MIKTIIKTATKVIYDGNAESVILPAYHGNIQILNNHSNLITKLSIGIIKITGEKEYSFMCFGGIATIANNEINVLTEEAFLPKMESINEIENAIKLAREGKPLNSINLKDLIIAEKHLRYYLLKEEK